MATQTMTEELPNGPVAAALLAGGIGCAAMGIITVLSEASSSFANQLKWVGPVGPLSGKTISTVIIYALSWVVLHFVFQGKNANFSRIVTISLILLVVGLLGTFPPFFELFVPKA